MELPNSESGFFLFNGVFLFQTPRKWSAGIVITAPLYQSKQVLFLLGWFSWRPKLSKETIWEPDTGYNGVHSNTTFFIFLTHQAMHCQLQCWSTSFLSAVKVAEPKIVPLGRPGLVEFLAGLTCPMDKRPSKPSSNKSLTIRQVHVSGPRHANVRAACPKNKMVIHFFFSSPESVSKLLPGAGYYSTCINIPTHLRTEGHFCAPSNISQTATRRVSCWITSLYLLESPLLVS